MRSMAVLLVVDESELGLRVAVLGAAFARRMQADLVLHLPIPIEPIEPRSSAGAMFALEQHEQRCRERADACFQRVAAAIAPGSGAVRTILTFDEAPCDAALRVAAEHQCSLIVVGSHGRGAVSRLIGGSLVDDLVRLSPLPVLVCREDMDPIWPPPALGGADSD